MFKTMGFKVSAAIFVVLLISFIVMQVILNLDFKNTANKMSRANLDTVSTSVFQTMRMAMNLGDPEKIKEAIEDAKSIEGISDIKIYPSKDTIDLFEMKAPQISNDKRIIEQFSNPKIQALEENVNGCCAFKIDTPFDCR